MYGDAMVEDILSDASVIFIFDDAFELDYESRGDGQSENMIGVEIITL